MIVKDDWIPCKYCTKGFLLKHKEENGYKRAYCAHCGNLLYQEKIEDIQ